MTQEQWLVYIWSIYPNGGFSLVWCLGFIISLVVLLIAFIGYSESEKSDKWQDHNYYYKNTTWYKLGYWKIIIPSIFATLLFLSNLVPNRDGFMYILATPYVVNSGKSLIEDLKDENSKVFKLNKLLDKSLDKAIQAMEKEDIKVEGKK